MEKQGKKESKWKNEETEALRAGVEKHGLGKWKVILTDSQFASRFPDRSNCDLRDKWRNLCGRKRKQPPPHSSTKRTKKVVEEELSDTQVYISDTQDYHSDAKDDHNPYRITYQRRGSRRNAVNQDMKLDSEKVHSYLETCNLKQPPPHSSTKRTKEVVEEELNVTQDHHSDTEDDHSPCKTTCQRRGSHRNTVNQTRKLDSEKVHGLLETCNLKQPPPRSSKKRRKEVVEEELSDTQDYHSDTKDDHNPCKITRQRRGSRRNTINQARKLDSEKVHSYLENLWLSFPEDKKSSFAHIDPLWFTLYSQDSNKDKVLRWIKKKDIFSRKYVVFPIVQWGHWCVLIFCHFGESLGSKLKTPCILLLDSLAKADHSKRLEPVIRKFVLDIYSKLERTEDEGLVCKMPFLVPKVPQQRDNEECGFFVLYYIKLFAESAPESFSITDGYPYFMKKDWFDFEGLDSFCRTLDSSHVQHLSDCEL